MAQQIDDEIRRLKQQMRIEASARRAKQPDAEHHSRLIFQQLTALPEYIAARTVMFYLDLRSEVRTRWFLPTAWAEGKRVVVPYCENGNIELFLLQDMQELSPGMMGVLEPKPELRHRDDRKVDPTELDLVIVPGVAFDHRGGRLGYGKGYYDRFLHQLRDNATKLAICFECQLFPELPLLPHDIPMDRVVTETMVYGTILGLSEKGRV
jgi:5-formyltetrahydrofolate cyclo-ligase